MEIEEDFDQNDLLAAQREARRRRILRNQNKRLELITGKVHDDEIPEPEIAEIPEPEIFPDPELERDVYETINPDNQDVFELLRTLNPDAQHRPTQQTTQIPETLLAKIIKSKLPIALMALIVYILFETNNDFLLGRSVFLILIVWEVFEFTFFRSLTSSQSNLNIILMLGGIPQKSSQYILQLLGLFNKTLKDVAIFMFVFVLIHLFWSYFFLKENLSIILDRDFNEFIKGKDEL